MNKFNSLPLPLIYLYTYLSIYLISVFSACSKKYCSTLQQYFSQPCCRRFCCCCCFVRECSRFSRFYSMFRKRKNNNEERRGTRKCSINVCCPGNLKSVFILLILLPNQKLAKSFLMEHKFTFCSYSIKTCWNFRLCCFSSLPHTW